MGDLQVCCGGQNGDVMEDCLFTSSFNTDPLLICDDKWGIAEETTQEVVRCIHPTLDSEEKRKDVIEYIQRLIKCALGCEVFPYGSVPLKTYLPDGDIDLTTLSIPNGEESLARDVLAVLQGEEQNENAEYELKDTQFIDAEVKLVKCLVQNIVIDISFNQLGGLCTLCFLEQVDRLVGKDHLFKRSIILIKAWCYYESRILGAHHGLISTYALETLVLYIFHLFNSSLNGPLEVLYRFLDYFSKFDWENYCISLNGPVCKSSLPDIVVEKLENGGDDLMLSEEFIRNCVDMFSVPSRGLETNLRAFPLKHLNIFDPLKENNNLGRSVHRGNFYRIRSAFKYGARKLGRILLLPRERIANEIKRFFANTLERHGQKYGSDAQNSALIFGAKGFNTCSSSSHSETFSDYEMNTKSSTVNFDDDTMVEDKFTLGFRSELDKCSTKLVSSQMVSEIGCSTDGTLLSGHRLAGDANELGKFRSLSLRSANETSECSPPSSNFGSSLCRQYYHAPHLYFPGSSTENGSFDNGNLCRHKSSDSVDEKSGFDSWLGHRENHLVASNTVCLGIDNNYEGVSSCDSAISSPDANMSESLSLDFRERVLAGIAGETETLNPMSDLSGDYDSHIRSLLYGQCCHGYALSAPVLHSPPTSPSQFQNKKPWDTVRRSMPLKRNSYFQMNTNGAVLGPTVYPTNNSTPSSAAFGSQERHKARGTGTYFPKTNYSFWESPAQERGRNQAPGTGGQLQTHSRNNGLDPSLPETSAFEEGSNELPHTRFPTQGRGKSCLSRHSHRSMRSNSHSNGFSNSYRRLEFGSFGPLPEGCSQVACGNSHARGSALIFPSLEVQSSKPVSGNQQERIAENSYHLKNKDDFPPLST